MASLANTENHVVPARLPGDVVRLSMSRVILAWAFGAIFFNLSAGAIYTSFTRQLGVSESVFGFLAGVSPLTNFLQIPAARMLETWVTPRKMMLWAGITGRALWVVAAALPLLVKYCPEIMPRAWLVPLFVLLVSVSGIFQSYTGPSFFLWMSELVPARVNAKFWARRSQVGTLVAVGAAIVGGYIADHAAYIKEWSDGALPPLMLYSILLILAAICGVMDIAVFCGVQEPEEVRRFKPKDQLPSFFGSLMIPLREPQVQRYMLFTAATVTASGLCGPLIWLLCLEKFGWGQMQTGLVLQVVPLGGVALLLPFWGVSIRNYGIRPNARIMSLLLLYIPLAWLWATPDSWRAMLVLNGLASGIAAAFDICNIQFMTRSCPQLSRPTLIAVFGIVAGTTVAVANWAGGAIAQCLDDFQWDYHGHHFCNYHVLIAVSFVIRLFTAFVLAPRLEEPEATPTREAVRETVATLYQAFAVRFTRSSAARDE